MAEEGTTVTDLDTVENAIRRRSFGTLSTLDRDGNPHATAVTYAAAGEGTDLTLYITTRTTNVKVGNIRRRPPVALVIPIPHRFLPMMPPAAVQFVGSAEILDHQNADARRAFHASWFLRRILAAEERIVSQGAELCFIAVRPRRWLSTYGIGMSALDIVRHPGEAIGRVDLTGGN